MEKIKRVFVLMNRRKYLFLIILALGYVCYRMFVANYDLVNPIVSKRAESYISVWNERNACLMDLEQVKKDIEFTRQVNNPDL